MEWELFPRGLVIGVAVAAPVGPMALLCLRRTLARGRFVGVVSGLGVASADALYGAVAAFGLTSISEWLVAGSDGLRLIGGLFLLLLGVRSLRSIPPAARGVDPGRSSAEGVIAFTSTLGLTLANPTTILSFVAIFAGFGVGQARHGAASATALVLGVFLGSTLWWIVLISTVAWFRVWFTPQRLRWINVAAGVAIALFGVLAIASVFRP